MKDNKFGTIVFGVMGIICNGYGEVLFVKQKSGPFAGNWLVPGGSVEFGEDSISAVKREVLEETGVKILKPEFKSMYVMIGEWEKGKYHLVMQGFRCMTNQQIPRNFMGDNVDAIAWKKPNDIILHSTDKLILTDCQLAHFTKGEIEKSLQKDKISMEVYPKYDF